MRVSGCPHTSSPSLGLFHSGPYIPVSGVKLLLGVGTVTLGIDMTITLCIAYAKVRFLPRPVQVMVSPAGGGGSARSCR